MERLKGKYAEAIVYTDIIEEEAISQIANLCNHVAFRKAKIRVMPDVHSGKGCVIGFTADLGKKVVPNLVGVDIGCGMLTTALGNMDIDFKKLDLVINNSVPAGFEIHDKPSVSFESLNSLYCRESLQNIDRIQRSVGTLGGGNHFIECDIDPTTGCKYLVVHTGSRNLGKQVAEFYQQKAIESIMGDESLQEEKRALIERYKAIGREKEIGPALKWLADQYRIKASDTPKELCYLEGKLRDAYLHDMRICQEYARLNRAAIANIIMSKMEWNASGQFETVHNYIDHDNNIVRKGAISAKMGEQVLIPINMRDGCILAVGKGNDDWNQSAPHGAGRLMSRRKAKETLSMDMYQSEMAGIFSTSVSESTLDEAPMAYKSMESILSQINDTVEVNAILKPVYNFKAK